MTFPTKTESTFSGLIPADSIAALLAIAWSSVAETSFKAPPKAPNGVLLAETIKIPIIFNKLKHLCKKKKDMGKITMVNFFFNLSTFIKTKIILLDVK